MHSCLISSEVRIPMFYGSFRRQKINPNSFLDYLLEGWSEEQLERAATDNKWSIYEILAHLGRYQEIFRERYQTILQQGQARFGRYRDEDDPGFRQWHQKAWSALSADMKKDRGLISEELLSLNANSLNKTGTHPLLGTMDIRDWLEFFLLHEAHHPYRIFQLTRILNESSPPL